MQSLSKSLTRMWLSHRAADIYNAENIGVALGPGLPIGLVSLGMLIALEQLKIEVRLISGTSMGAVIGALYASGLTPEEIRGHATELFSRDGVMIALMDDRKIPFGLSTGEKLIEELKRMAGWDPEFYELKYPLYVVAADKVSQRSVILRHGRVFDAVRASLAMPLLVEEKQMGGMRLADGAIFTPLDTEVLYSEGADFVLAMQAKPIRSEKIRKLPLKSKVEPHLLKALGWKTSREIYFSKPACDILLRPRVPRYLAKDSTRVGEIIDLGIKIIYDAITEIEKGNFPKKTADPEKEQKAIDATISNINLEMEKEVLDIEAYLNDLERRTENLSDAEMMIEFPKFSSHFQTFLDNLSNQYSDPAVASNELKVKIKNLTNLVNQSPFLKRCLSKPQGYAGDFQMMNYIYEDDVFEAQSNIGKLLNYCFFTNPAIIAVRNRAKIIQGLIQFKFTVQSTLSVSSIACGPAVEVAETIKLISENKYDGKIIWTLLDQDKDALQYVSANLPNNAILETNIVSAGVRDLIKKNISLGQQDIIYSLGLFDYLEEKVAVILINRLYSELNPGGLLLIGNFHTTNPLRTWMEGATEWFLIHRTEEELLALGKAGAPEGRHFVMAEPEGVNLILVTSKPLEL